MNVLNIGIEYTMRSMKVLARFGGFLAANITVNRLTTLSLFIIQKQVMYHSKLKCLFLFLYTYNNDKNYMLL